MLLKLTKESISFALSSVTVNKLRTFLSLFGITIGIFIIISVFTVFDWMEKSIKDSIASLGDNTVYVQKSPWNFDRNIAWWDIVRRPAVTPEDYNNLLSKSNTAEVVCYNAFASRVIKYKGNSLNDTYVTAVTEEYDQTRTFEIDNGRYFSPTDFNEGMSNVIIGAKAAKNLFGDEPPIGKEITINGYKTTVIGTFKKEGKGGIIDDGMDNVILVTVKYAKRFINYKSRWLQANILVKGKKDVSVEELSDEVKMILRNARRLKPEEEDNFAINQASMLTEGFKPAFRIINIAGWIIGGFSILVGGFGIANIMFVSVKERTSIIGIQMALGAKRRFILSQFLFESVLLSVFGGVLGLLFVFLGTLVANHAFETHIFLTVSNISLAIGISAAIGILFGYWPASTAAKMNPVEAIGYTF